MPPRTLHLTSGFALLVDDERLSVFRLDDGIELHSWQREQDDDEWEDEEEDEWEDEDEHEDEGQGEDQSEAADQSPKIFSFAFDHRAPRLVLRWKDHVELLDLRTGSVRQLDGVAVQCDTLIAIGPDGRLFGEGEAMGLAAIKAFARLDDEQADNGGSPFSDHAGRLDFALGFNTLPHVQTLVFSEDGRHALSGTMSQYRAHLAYLSVLRPGAALHIEPLEVVRIAALPGFGQAIVQEASYAGSKRLSLWQIEPRRHIERIRDLHVIENHGTPTEIHDFVLEENGRRVIVFLSDGRIVTIDLESGSSTYMQRVGTPMMQPVAGNAAIDFTRGLVAVREPGGLVMMDLGTGKHLTTFDPVDAVYKQGSRLLTITGDRIAFVDGERSEQLAIHSAPIVAAMPDGEGLVYVDAEHRAARMAF